MVAARRSAGFTFVELLVVIAIMATLLGLLGAAVQRARSAAQRVQCMNNLRQVGLALHSYHDGYHVLPPGLLSVGDPYPYLAWTARLLPYLEQEQLWEQAESDYAAHPLFSGPPPHRDLMVVLSMFVCPADGRAHGIVHPEEVDVAFTSYLGVAGTSSGTRNGVLYFNSRVRFADITDGTSNTLAVGERPPSPDNHFGWWYAGVGQQFDGSADATLGVADFCTTFRAPTCPLGPYSFGPGRLSNMCDTFHFWSLHPGGAHFLMADGSIHFFPYSAAGLLPALASRSGGETAALPD
jgi:prepilin-type N-terminal cleavage/methylation domain-containing protein/prepilin-type processing-associated H-X9-DG protein